MTFQEAIERLHQRYERVEVRTTGSGKLVIEVDDLPPLPVPGFYQVHFPESPVSDEFLGYLCAYFAELHPTDVGLDWPNDA